MDRLHARLSERAGGAAEISGGEASPRAEPPDHVTQTVAPRRVRRNLSQGVLAHPPGRICWSDAVRWLRSFPRKKAYSPHAASSLHHRNFCGASGTGAAPRLQSTPPLHQHAGDF